MFWESFFTLCTDRGVSPSQVSAELNLSSGAITKWKNGASPRPATIRKLADYFAVPVEYLLGTLPDTVRPVEMKKVPILGQIACGRPIFADEERGEYADAPVDVKADLCLTVKGDSMEGAGIRDGDLVFIRKQLTVDNGDIAAVIINDEARTVTVDEKNIEMSFREYELLKYLIQNKNVALSRDKILNSVWNYEYYGDSRTIDSHIKKIRHKLGKKGKHIQTIRGIGYKFVY